MLYPLSKTLNKSDTICPVMALKMWSYCWPVQEILCVHKTDVNLGLQNPIRSKACLNDVSQQIW